MRLLVVKLSSFGDVVHTFPAITDLKAARPDIEVDWLVEEGFAPFVALTSRRRRRSTPLPSAGSASRRRAGRAWPGIHGVSAATSAPGTTTSSSTSRGC